jgi:flagellar basal body rod protein FlgB
LSIVSLVDSTSSVLEAAMSGAMQRQTALTSDLANADTAGFKPTDVDFQDQLNAALQSGASPSQVSFSASQAPNLVATGGVGVNSDQASADLSQNGLTYQDLAQVLAAHNSILEYAMEVK